MDKSRYSHIKKDKDNNVILNKDGKITGKLLKVHLNEVYESALDNLYPYLNFNIDKRITESIIKYSSLFHDFGKYTDYFQEYLLQNKSFGEEKNHSFISSIFISNYLFNNKLLNEKEIFLIYTIIKNHHGDINLDINYNKKYILVTFPKQVESILNNKNIIESELLIKLNKDYFEVDKILKNYENIVFDIYDEKDVKNYLTFNYFFSLLIESDKINASNTKKYTNILSDTEVVINYIRENKKEDLKRDKVRKEIEESIYEIDLEKDKLFTITAPTGIGKTLSSLNFVIKLKKRIFDEKKIIPKIIYCLPFINIIDQTVEEFENVFKNTRIKILKHHQYSDIFSKTKEDENKPDYSVNNIKMELETWQGDLIVTTFVQFLHTLIGSKNKLLKKFHHLAGNIIILDEIQAINYEYIPLVGALLYYLTEVLDSKIIIMTATQPALFKNLSKLDIKENIIPLELLKNNRKYFETLNRTKIIPLIDKENPIVDNDDFIKIFCERYTIDKSALLVFNTIKRSIQIFELMKEVYENEIKEKKVYCFYLSTNIVPKQRKLIIKLVKKLLKNNKKVILVSTQCIEAGVDIDFDIGFRDIGPLDSIIQVAGRINRNNNYEKVNSPLYIVNFLKDSIWVYGSEVPSKVMDILSEYSEIYEKDYNLLNNKYFSINWKYDKSKKIYDSILRFETSEINKFKLIEEKGEFVDVFIDFYNGKNKKYSILNKYIEAINTDDKKNILVFKKEFNMRVVSIKKEKLSVEIENNKIFDGLYFINNELKNDYYDNEIGFKIDKQEEITYIF